MQFVVIITLERAVAEDLNRRPSCPGKHVGIHIEPNNLFNELNLNSPVLHSHIQSRVFLADNVASDTKYTVCLSGYEPLGPFSVPNDREFEVVRFPNKPINTKSDHIK